MSYRKRLRGLTGCLVLVAALVAAGLTTPTAPGAVSPKLEPTAWYNPVRTSTGGVRNVTFYYGGTPLRRGPHLNKLGKPAMVVTTPGADGAEAVKAIHSTGAKAYRYLQFYWAPGNTTYEGINLARHPGWAFCGTGHRKALGRTTNGGRQRWFFIDANEKAVRARFLRILAGFKRQGWDGVFFDRGEAATQYAKDAHGHAVWDRRSSCTARPHRRGARFADAYVNMLGLAHRVGLQAMMNNGKSPFDPVTPMRPNPRNANCRAARWARCSHLSDVWSKLNLVLNETAVRPRDVNWKRTFVGNQRSERNARHGHRTVALITTASLGGAGAQTRARVFYEWSRIKLFNIPVAVNTGDGRCAGAAGVCNRYGSYPVLVNTVFGRPRGPVPRHKQCVQHSAIHCVWLRRYARGVNVLNASGRPHHATRVDLSTATCRYVYNVETRRPLARNHCVRHVFVRLPAWSGRPLRYSSRPW